MKQTILATYYASFKLERIQRLAEQLKKEHIQLRIVKPISRNPILVFQSMFNQTDKSVLLTHDWLSFAVLMTVVHLLHGNPYILVLTSFVLEARERTLSPLVPVSFYRA